MLQKLVRYFIDSIIVICALAVIVALGLFLYVYQYEGRIFPNVSIDGVAVGGLSTEAAEFKLSAKIDDINRNGFRYIVGDNTVITIYPINYADDAALAQEIVDFDVQSSVRKAYDIGRTGSLIQRFVAIFGSISIPVVYEFNQELWLNTMHLNLGAFEKESKDPLLVWNTNGTYTITPEVNGITFDFDRARNDTIQMIEKLDISDIKLSAEKMDAHFNQSQALLLAPEIDLIRTSVSQYFITFNKDKWKFVQKEFLPWIGISFDELTHTPKLGLDKAQVQTSFEKISSMIDRPAKDARLVIKDGKVYEFVPSQTGREIDMDLMFSSIQDSLLLKKIGTSELIVKEAVPAIQTKDVNNFGITEIIGTGQSNFAGSPANRIHNIKLGVKTVDGTLVPPGEEFSLIKLLGNTDEAQGYLPELVIKGNKTEKEFGGGLCQIGTTVFRATMSAGLKVLERRNHSFNVSYYLEDGLPGVDATIYNPKPDYRFLNDTTHYILISGRIEGTKVLFDFWGAHDGRTAYRTTPTVWDWQDPGPVQYVDTEELKPGEEKCTEKAHKGVKASFDYFVKYPDGHEEKQTFFSNYKVWPAVCLRGKAPTDDAQVTEQVENSVIQTIPIETNIPSVTNP